MMRNTLSSLLATLLFVVTANAADDVVAKVGNKNITVSEFNARYEDVLKQAINPPSKEVFLEDLIRYEVGVQEAEKRNMQNDAAVKERIRQEMYKGLVEKELGDKIKAIKVNESEMKDYYTKNPEIKTSHILIEFKPDATEAQKKAAKDRATEIYNEVRKSKRPFEELVALYTDDVLSKRSGGDVGWQSSVTLVPNYYQAALKLKVNEMTGLIETQYGYHIIKLTGRRSYQDANKRQIRAAVFDAKRKNLFDAYFVQLKKKYPTQVFKVPN